MNKLRSHLSLAAYKIMLPFIRRAVRNSTRVYVAIIHKGRVLLVKNIIARDNWRLPGGGMHENELPQSGAAREVQEELGISLDAEQLIYINEGDMDSDRLKYHYVNFAYVADELPVIKPNKLEIAEHNFFEVLPADSQDHLAEFFKALKEEKLL